jgi:DNA ligase-1
MFQEINNFLTKMNESSSSNNKVDVIKASGENIHKLLRYTYDDMIQFGVSSKNVIKRKDLLSESCDENFYDLLDKLKDRVYTGHEALSKINKYVQLNPESKDVLYKVLDKDLKIRASNKLINKAVPNLIPEFSVALAENFNEKTIKKINFDRQWFVSRKLDGVRCIVIVDEKGQVNSYSRAGKLFNTLKRIEDEIKSLNLKSVVFDGEVCSYSDNDKDDFQSIMKEIRRKNHIIENASYNVFDFLTLKEFNEKSSNTYFNTRIYKLKDALFNKNLKFVKVLNQQHVNSLAELNSYVDDFKKDKNRNHWEGLIVRKDEKYKGKRSRDILKVKTFFDAEYIVQSVIFGPFRYVSDNIEVENEMLSAVVIEHKGNLVQVGSGFTIEQRQHFYLYPEDIIDKTITVQYFEESQNQNGEFSLRFPVVKTIHGEKRVI